jgi:hypothetical protein
MLKTEKDGFDYGFELLDKRYPKETLHEDIKALYLQHFRENLTDDEFLEAVKYIILHSRFMPTAGDIVEYIHGGKEAKGIQEWQGILTASGKHEKERQESLAYLSDRARVALRALGGINTLRLAISHAQNALVEQQRMEKKFLTVYCQCSTQDRNILAQAPVAAPVEVKEEVGEPAPMPDFFKKQLEKLATKTIIGSTPDPILERV